MLARHTVQWYAIIRPTMTFHGPTHLLVGEQELERVPRIAIGSDHKTAEHAVLHCDHKWRVLGITTHPSEAEAKSRVERIYPDLAGAWVHRPVSEQEALDYLNKRDAREKCSFCGRRPDEVTNIVAKGKARICDICLREFQARIATSSL
ncbi:MAG: hypothetical protein QOH21_745 [Acidobacteriota bacterium]|nr:hypothetical protein [Acidobacteriota bacterium]